MTGIIFAAGIGSRLKPFTDHHPKALAGVGGKPLLQYVAERLIAAGCEKIIVNVHHFPQQIIDFLDTMPFRDRIVISDESNLLLDTGGALAKIWREHPELIESAEAIIAHNADIYTDADLTEMLMCHKDSGADATLLTDSKRTSTRHLLFDTDRLLRGWENTATNETRPEGLDTRGLLPAAFGGIHIFKPGTLKAISEAQAEELEPRSIIDWYLDNCRSKKFKAFTPATSFVWHDVGTPEKLAAANAAAQSHN